jgi:acyl carrier protein
LQLVRKALEHLNEELQYDSLNVITEQTVIFGGEDSIDSLSLVTLVVGLEADVAQEFGKEVLLSDEKAMSLRNSPYRTAGTLADFIAARLKDAK